MSAKIKSAQDLGKYLENCPGAGKEFLAMLNHFSQINKHLEELPGRRFWLNEGESYRSSYLTGELREFISKRYYAFLRKDMLPLLQENLSCFSQLSTIPGDIAAKLLLFEALSPEDFAHLTALRAKKPKKTKKIDKSPQETEEQAKERISKRMISLSRRQQKHMEDDLQKLENTIRNKLSLPKETLDWFDKLKPRSPQLLPETVQGVLIRFEKREIRYPLMCLKNHLVQYSRMVSTSGVILLFINYGSKKSEQFLRKFAQVTDNAKVNEMAHDYLQWFFEQEVARHGRKFRRNVEKTKNIEELACIAGQYPLNKVTFLEKYPELKIIERVKNICEQFFRGDDPEKILHQLSHSDAHIKKHLTGLLVSGACHRVLQQKLSHVSNINELLKQLGKLKKDQKVGSEASTLFQLAITFLKKRSHVSYQDLKTSFNFLPDHIQRQIFNPIKRKVKRDLQREIEKIMAERGRTEKRWTRFLQILQDPKYQSPEIDLFGYSLEEWLKKFKSVSQVENNIEKNVYHIFSGNQVPHTLLELIIEKQSMQDNGQENELQICLEKLTALKLKAEQGDLLSLKRPVMDLFQYHGKLNFGQNPSWQELTGYEIARIVGKYYANPNRTKIHLPEEVKEDLAQLLSQAIDEERNRQLAKLKNEQE